MHPFCVPHTTTTYTVEKKFRVIGIKTGRPHAGGNETLCLGLMNDEIHYLVGHVLVVLTSFLIVSYRTPDTFPQLQLVHTYANTSSLVLIIYDYRYNDYV